MKEIQEETLFTYHSMMHVDRFIKNNGHVGLTQIKEKYLTESKQNGYSHKARFLLGLYMVEYYHSQQMKPPTNIAELKDEDIRIIVNQLQLLQYQELKRKWGSILRTEIRCKKWTCEVDDCYNKFMNPIRQEQQRHPKKLRYKRYIPEAIAHIKSLHQDISETLITYFCKIYISYKKKMQNPSGSKRHRRAQTSQELDFVSTVLQTTPQTIQSPVSLIELNSFELQNESQQQYNEIQTFLFPE